MSGPALTFRRFTGRAPLSTTAAAADTRATLRRRLSSPDSRRFSAGGYLSGYPSGPTNAVVGTYTEVATVQFHCSCVGTVGSGGSDQVCLAHLDGQHRCPTAGEPLACPKRTQGSDARVSDGSTGKPAEPRRDEPRSMVVEVSSVLTVSLPSGGTGGRALTQAGQLEPREQGRPQ